MDDLVRFFSAHRSSAPSSARICFWYKNACGIFCALCSCFWFVAVCFFLSPFVLAIWTSNVDYNGVICSLVKMWAGEEERLEEEQLAGLSKVGFSLFTCTCTVKFILRFKFTKHSCGFLSIEI